VAQLRRRVEHATTSAAAAAAAEIAVTMVEAK